MVIPVAMMLSGLASGQNAATAPDWNSLWQGVENSEFDTAAEQLVAQTNLLMQWGDAAGWNLPQTWQRAVGLLDKWESSADIETAREQYLAILDRIGWSLYQSNYLPIWESELRKYYQNALRVTNSPRQESLFLFHLAASLYRSNPYSLDSMRRIEAYLEQAALLADGTGIAGHIHLLMGNIYLDWSRRVNLPAREEAQHGALAVFHFRQCLAIEAADPAVKEQASTALNLLLQKGLSLNVRNRFHPDDDIRVKVSTRNLSEIKIRVDSIPWQSNDIPVSVSSLETYLESYEFNEITTVVEQSISMETGNQVDWQDVEIRLGEGLTAGWYAVEVSGEGLTERSLLLVTAIDLVFIPRNNGTMTLWAVDAQSAKPVENGIYHLLDQQGQPLFSGRLDAGGMADVVMGADETWMEVHAHIDGNPAFVRRSDLRKRSRGQPWLIADAIRVLPGDSLSWIVMYQDDNGNQPVEDMLLQLPDGGALIPQRMDQVVQNQYSVQLPEDIDQFGPLYLLQPDGESILLAHLMRNHELPLSIELSGEPFAPDSNLFVSSTPVGIRVFPNEMGTAQQPPYIRIIVEIMDRPFVRPARDHWTQADRQIAFEQITRFADATATEAFWELPEVEQTRDLVPLRITVYPLGSDDLLAETFLAMVPYRARVSLRSSEQIIPVGQSVDIEAVDVLRGYSHTRPLQGELVAYRESWENRYIHRKKGTPLSEEDYDALPERSLLGTAKTDYRLVERGVVREEVLREQVTIVSRTRMPISFERQGYYRIEFQSRDTDLRADYPDGPIELWVLPETGRLDAFQSANPRLIVEQNGSGVTEILVLADRTNASILVDLQHIDGRSQTARADPGASGIYLQLDEATSPLETCLVAIARERQTAFLCEHLRENASPAWNVQMQRVNGLNPGSPFTWQAFLDKGEENGDPVWVVYAEQDAEMARNLVMLQQKEHSLHAVGCETEVAALDRELPLFQPVGSGTAASEADLKLNFTLQDSGVVAAVYPELQVGDFKSGGIIESTRIAGSADQRVWELTGQVPSATGRWSLMSFYPGGYKNMFVGEWEFSTDQPIRTAIRGPSILRLNDTAIAELEIENTTRQVMDLQIELESNGLRLPDEHTLAAIELPPGDSGGFALAYQATEPGTGTLRVNIQAVQASSTASVTTRVYEEISTPAVRSLLIGSGVADWQSAPEFQEFKPSAILASSGIGTHVDFIWSAVRGKYLQREPLLALLTDWAGSRVRLHHGLTNDPVTGAETQLLQSLSESARETGISWTTGAPPDPWLSALVLWAIETFDGNSSQVFRQYREQLREYLEAILIDTTVTRTTRMFALRTVAMRAATDPEIRPSRIQARSFLEFFQDRELLQAGELAMLMDTAWAYGFTEEVGIVKAEILKRLQQQDKVDQMTSWEASLVYLALSQDSESSGLRYRPLGKLMDDMGAIASTPGWEEAGSILNLLAAFFWDGDFSVDGSATIQLSDREPFVVDLRPHGANQGFWKSAEFSDPQVRMRVDTTASSQPVIISVTGEAPRDAELPPQDGVKVSYQRQYVEQTLLSGSNTRTMDTDLDRQFLKGEILIQTVELVVEEPSPYAEFRFNVPAGTSHLTNLFKHVYQPRQDNGEPASPEVGVVPQENPLFLTVRVSPLSPGIHRFTLPYRIDWCGEFVLPWHQLRYPVTGEVRRIGNDQLLRVVTE